MPRAFSDQEKQVIRKRLHDKGRKLFETYGLKKTSVDELARSVSISKGAFYLFYDSKEELFMEIMEELETDFRTRVFELASAHTRDSRLLLATFLKEALLTSWNRYPLLKNFSGEDFEYLSRKIPAERLRKHMEQDNIFVEEFVRKLKKQGIQVKVPPRTLANLAKSLVFIGIHRADLGEPDYSDTMNILTDLLARYITEG